MTVGPDIIAILRARGLVTTITIEPYAGQGGSGPTYGAPAAIEAYVEAARRRVTNTVGKQVLSSTTCYCRLGTDAPPDSRVTVGSTVTYVLSQTVHDGASAPLPSHVELHLV